MMITKNLFALLLLDIHTTFLQNFKKIGDIEFFHLVHLAYFAPYTLTAHVTGFRRVLVTPYALVYERNAASQLAYSITLATEQRYLIEYSY